MAPGTDSSTFETGVTNTPLHPGRSLAARRRGEAQARAEGKLDGRRIAAALIDLWTAGLAGLLAGWIAHRVGNDLTEQGRALASFAAFLAIDLLAPLRPGRHRGQTLGKQLLGLRIARVDGGRPPSWLLLVRGTLRWPAWSLALNRLALDRPARGHLHERWTATAIVDDQHPRPLIPVRPRPPGVAAAVGPATRATSSREDR